MNVVELSPVEKHDAQDIVVRAPAFVTLHGRRIAVESWNAAGFSLEEEPAGAAPQGATPVTFEVKARGREYTTRTTAALVEAKDGKSFYAFVNQSAPQHAELDAIVTDYLTGKLQPPAPARTAELKITPLRWLGLAATWMLLAAVIVTLVLSAYQRFFIIGSFGAVAPTRTVQVTAPVDGVVRALPAIGDAVASRQAIASVEPYRREAAMAVAPCDCRVVSWNVALGSFVRAGAPLLVMSPVDDRAQLTLQVPLTQSSRIHPGAPVDAVLLATGRRIKGTVISIEYPVLRDPTQVRDAAAIVRVAPKVALSPKEVGQVVSATITGDFALGK